MDTKSLKEGQTEYVGRSLGRVFRDGTNEVSRTMRDSRYEEGMEVKGRMKAKLNRQRFVKLVEVNW